MPPTTDTVHRRSRTSSRRCASGRSRRATGSSSARTSPSSPSRPTPGEPGHYGARYGRYLGEFARGGAGVVIGGQAAVHPTTAYQMPNNASVWDAAAVPGLTEVADAVHEHGALAFLQLAHNGGVNGGAWSKLPGVGAVARRELHGAAEADRALRDRGGDRRLRAARPRTAQPPGSTASRSTPRTAT